MKRFRSLGFLAVMILVLIFSAACGTSGNKSGQNKSNTSGSNGGNASSQALSGKLNIAGSTALQPLVAAAAQQFQNNNSGVQISVNGGGSGTGLSEVSAGNVDIGDSDIFAEEGSGIDASKLVDHKVAVVGMTAAINPKAGVSNLTKQQLQDIFLGKVTNWKQVGGNDVKITVINRPEGSGTRATFVKYALGGQDPTDKGISQDSSDTVAQMVEQTDGAIGYEAFSYFTSAKGKMVEGSIDGVKPTVANVESGKFPVWAYEHMYTKGQPTKIEKAFLDYMVSSNVQTQLVPAQGYIPVSKMQVQRDVQGKVTKK